MKKDLSVLTVFVVCLAAVVGLMAGCQEEIPPAGLGGTDGPSGLAAPEGLTARRITKKSSVTGHFRIYGFGLGGQKLAGTVDVRELKDGSFSVEWVINDVDWYGTGRITEDGELYITYSGPDGGDGTWVLMSNNELHGKWRPAGSENTGIEVWSREQKSK